MKLKNTVMIAAIASVAVLESGCSSNKAAPSFAEALSTRTHEATKIEKEWAKGDKLAEKGAKALKQSQEKQAKADKLIKEAAKLQEEGNKWSAEGATLKAGAEARYRDLRANPVAIPSTPAPAAGN